MATPSTAADRAGDLKERAIATFNLIRAEPAKSDASLAALGELFADAEQLDDKDFEGDILHLWGDRFFNRGEYEPAIEKLEESAERYEQTGNKDSLSTVYNSFGRLFRAHGQMAAALHAQLKALAIQESIDSPRNRLQSLNAVAVTYQSLGNIPKARGHYERAIAIAEQIGASNTLDFLRANFGDFLVESGDVERGRLLLVQSLPGASAGYRTIRLAELSYAYRLLHRFDDALDAANRAIDTCRAGTPINCVGARLCRAEAELALGDTAAALADTTAALGSLEQIHVTLAASDFLKQGFSQLWGSAYSVAIDLHARRREWTAALETAELARARAFVDLLASREHAAGASRPRSVALRARDDGEGPPSEASVAPTTVDDLVAIAARRRATLLQYWSAKDRLFMWVVSPSGTVRGASVNIGRAQIERLVRSIAPEAGGSHKASAWKALHAALIEPIDRYLPASPAARLIVVPHGPLLRVPFAALRDPQGRYLIERFTLSSVPSAATLRFTSARRHGDSRRGSLLLVADPSPPPSIPGEPRLPRLPGAVDETRAIAHLVPASRTTLLTETEATEHACARGRAADGGDSLRHPRDRPGRGSALVVPRAGGRAGWRRRRQIDGSGHLWSCPRCGPGGPERMSLGRRSDHRAMASPALRAPSSTPARRPLSSASGMLRMSPPSGSLWPSIDPGSRERTKTARCAWRSWSCCGICARAVSPSARPQETWRWSRVPRYGPASFSWASQTEATTRLGEAVARAHASFQKGAIAIRSFGSSF